MRSAPVKMMRGAGAATARGLVFFIQLYRHTISPLRLPTCRFTPTCSQYAVAALTEYGLLRGSWLAMVRLAKCGPWHRGGWDPIPERPGSDRPEPEDHEARPRAGMTASDADPVRSKLRV